MAFAAPILTKLINGEQYRVELFYTKFYPDPPRSMETTFRYSFMLEVKCGCHCSDFHETRTYAATFGEELLYQMS
jgi:hypothetical protein